MYKWKSLFLMCLLLIVIALVGSVSILPAWGAVKGLTQQQTASNNAKTPQNQLKEAQNEVAALRKSKGRMQYTTNDDRWAAAERNAARRAAAVAAKGQGGGK